MSAIIFLLLGSIVRVHGQDQCFAQATSTVTECQPQVTSPSAISVPVPEVTITVTQPGCNVCKCSSTYTKTITRTGTVFNPTGTTCQTWTIEEEYPGLSESPVLANPTSTSDCFITTVATCAGSCGASEVTATLTYPTGGRTFTADSNDKTTVSHSATGIVSQSDVPVAAAAAGVKFSMSAIVGVVLLALF